MNFHSKHDTLSQRWVNAEPASQTVGQRQSHNMGSSDFADMPGAC